MPSLDPLMKDIIKVFDQHFPGGDAATGLYALVKGRQH